MSSEAIHWAWHQNLKPGEKLLLLALSDYVSEDGTSWVSSARLSEKTGMVDSAVRSNAAKLAEYGLISKVHRYKNNLQTTNFWRVEIDPSARRKTAGDLSPDSGGGDTPTEGINEEGNNLSLTLNSNARSVTRDAKDEPRRVALEKNPPTLEQWFLEAARLKPLWFNTNRMDVESSFISYERRGWRTAKGGQIFTISGAIKTCEIRWRQNNPAEYMEARRRADAAAQRQAITLPVVPEVGAPPRPSFLGSAGRSALDWLDPDGSQGISRPRPQRPPGPDPLRDAMGNMSLKPEDLR